MIKIILAVIGVVLSMFLILLVYAKCRKLKFEHQKMFFSEKKYSQGIFYGKHKGKHYSSPCCRNTHLTAMQQEENMRQVFFTQESMNNILR